MLASLRFLLVLIMMAGSFFACTDHQLRPVSPLKVRLKTTDNVNFGGFPFKTEYNYDASNRVASFTTSIGSKGVFQYDNQNRYNRFFYFPKVSDEQNGETTWFTYNSDNTSLVAASYVLTNGVRAPVRFQDATYAFDNNNRLLSKFPTSSNIIYQFESYKYTGDNITKVRSTYVRLTDSTTYEYDNKPNPYYGLIAPDISEVRRFSRNNVTKIINDYNKAVIAEYTYEYNAQGLPTKLKEKNGSGEVIYTYESY